MRVTRAPIQSQQQSIESIANRRNANADSCLLEDSDAPARRSSELSARSLAPSRLRPLHPLGLLLSKTPCASFSRGLATKNKSSCNPVATRLADCLATTTALLSAGWLPVKGAMSRDFTNETWRAILKYAVARQLLDDNSKARRGRNPTPFASTSRLQARRVCGIKQA